MSPVRRVVVAHLTDEEIDVLVDGSDDLVLRPYLDTLPEPERRAARRAAQRSLTVRGWLLPEPTTPSGGSDPTPPDATPPDGMTSDATQTGATQTGATMSVADSIASVLQVRRGAPEVLVMHRWVGETSCTRYLFVLSPVIVCEDLSISGVHTLSVAETAERESLVREFLVPPDACPSPPDEPTRLLPAGTTATDLVSALGHPRVLAEVATLQAGEGDVTQPRRTARQGAVIVALGPAGCFLLEQGGTSAWSVQPTTPQDLVGRVATR